MAVDLNPAEGRIALLRGRSTEPFPWYEKGGRITRVSGQRAYFTKEDGTETFSHEFSAIVDTLAEEAALLQFTKTAKGRLAKLLGEFKAEAEALEKVMNVGVKLKSVARVRRVRS